MKLFEFKKYFFDILSEEKDYLIFFISILRIGKRYNTFIQIHYRGTDYQGNYRPLQSLKARLKIVDYQLNHIRFEEGEIEFGIGSIRINFTLDSFIIDLKFTSPYTATITYNQFVIRSSGNASLSWIPVQLKASVNGTISMAGNQLNYNNASGYIDEVKTSILPLTLKIRKLFWGRLHHKEIDLSYSLIISKNDKSDSMLIIRFRSMIIEFTEIQYQTFDEKINPELNIFFPGKLILTARNGKYSVKIEISDLRELILNDFMDPNNQYKRVFTRIMRRITKDPRGIKFLARANVLLEDSFNKTEFRDISMISELVAFK
jgi:hypothetical protein